jgi:hypothetical protein
VDLHRCGRRCGSDGLCRRVRLAHEQLQSVLAVAVGAQQGQMCERWETRRLAFGQFELGERRIAAGQQGGQQRVAGVVGLQQRFALSDRRASRVSCWGPALLAARAGALLISSKVGVRSRDAEWPIKRVPICSRSSLRL